jgi:hypothetical protein
LLGQLAQGLGIGPFFHQPELTVGRLGRFGDRFGLQVPALPALRLTKLHGPFGARLALALQRRPAGPWDLSQGITAVDLGHGDRGLAAFVALHQSAHRVQPQHVEAAAYRAAPPVMSQPGPTCGGPGSSNMAGVVARLGQRCALGRGLVEVSVDG